MTARIQGSAVIADLPAGAVATIHTGLGRVIAHHARLTRADETTRDEAVRYIQDILVQQGYLVEAWHRPAGEVITVRLTGRCMDDVLSLLEREAPESAQQAAAMAVLRDAILRRDGLVQDNGAVVLPDTP